MEEDAGAPAGPLGLRPGDPVRLKRLQANQNMNGLVGYFVKMETEADGGRYVVELGKRGPVRVREHNVEKVAPPRRSSRLAQRREEVAAAEAEAAEKAPALKKKQMRKTPANKVKFRARAKVVAKAKAIKKTGTATKPKPAGAAGSSSFNVFDHRICSEPSLEVQDAIQGKWRPCHLYQSLRDGRIVIWYGGTEYEGLPPAKKYRFRNVTMGSSGFLMFAGRGGELLDGDGERIPTRRRPNL